MLLDLMLARIVHVLNIGNIFKIYSRLLKIMNFRRATGKVKL